MKNEITFDDYQKVQISVGTVLKVSKNNFITVKCGEGIIVLKNIKPNIKLKKGDYLWKMF